MTGCVVAGSADSGVIVCDPLPIEKPMVLGPTVPFEVAMALRSDPDPESAVVVTVKVAA
jgi:hypothetical protein